VWHAGRRGRELIARRVLVLVGILKGRYQLGNVGVDKRVILIWIPNK
jgi:hypothetical protein